MSLADRCRHEFDFQVIGRGAAYFLDGKASIASRAASTITLKVKGTRPYDVTIALPAHGSKELTVSCTCPYFEGVGTCKHLWAAILTVDHRGNRPRTAKSTLPRDARCSSRAEFRRETGKIKLVRSATQQRLLPTWSNSSAECRSGTAVMFNVLGHRLHVILVNFKGWSVIATSAKDAAVVPSTNRRRNPSPGKSCPRSPSHYRYDSVHRVEFLKGPQVATANSKPTSR